MYLKWLGVLESQAKEDQHWEVSGKPTLWQVVMDSAVLLSSG